jgi:hypothetical protein
MCKGLPVLPILRFSRCRERTQEHKRQRPAMQLVAFAPLAAWLPPSSSWTSIIAE